MNVLPFSIGENSITTTGFIKKRMLEDVKLLSLVLISNDVSDFLQELIEKVVSKKKHKLLTFLKV